MNALATKWSRGLPKLRECFESLEPSLMPREAEPREMDVGAGWKGLAVVERQTLAGDVVRCGMSTVVLGV